MPLSIELVLKLFPFFMVGQINRTTLQKIGNYSSKKFIYAALGIGLLLVTGISAGFAPAVNYTNNKIPSPFLFYCIAILGCLGLYFLSVGMQQIKLLESLGKKTLSILVMHKFPVLLFQIIGPFSLLLKEPDTVTGVLSAIIVSVIAIILSVLVGWGIEKYCPVLLGNHKK